MRSEEGTSFCPGCFMSKAYGILTTQHAYVLKIGVRISEAGMDEGLQREPGLTAS